MNGQADASNQGSDASCCEGDWLSCYTASINAESIVWLSREENFVFTVKSSSTYQTTWSSERGLVELTIGGTPVVWSAATCCRFYVRKAKE